MDDITAIEPARRAHLLRLPRGERVVVRPIRPADAHRLQAYLQGLSLESHHNRLFVAVNELSASELKRLSRMDLPGEFALMALADGEDPMIGEAMGAIEVGGTRCEIALSVAEAWQRRGLGRLLLRNIECRARLLGAAYLFGDVLRTNTAMTRLARKEGFSIASPFTDARLVEIVKDLAAPQLGVPCGEPFTERRTIAA